MRKGRAKVTEKALKKEDSRMEDGTDRYVCYEKMVFCSVSEDALAPSSATRAS
jgi:hypothetical protein